MRKGLSYNDKINISDVIWDTYIFGKSHPNLFGRETSQNKVIRTIIRKKIKRFCATIQIRV